MPKLGLKIYWQGWTLKDTLEISLSPDLSHFLAFRISRNQLLITWRIISSLSVFLVYWFCLSGRPWRRGWESSQVLLPGFCQDIVGRHQWSRWEACTCFTLSSVSALCGCQQVLLLRVKIEPLLPCPPWKQSSSWVPGLVLKPFQKAEKPPADRAVIILVGVGLLGLFCVGIKIWIGFFSHKGELAFILSFYKGRMAKTNQTKPFRVG